MKPRFLAASVLSTALLTAPAAQADPTYMLGIGFTFGGDLGLTAKVLSDNKEDETAGSLGVTFYPLSPLMPIGIDVGAAHVFDNAAVGLSLDFMKLNFQLYGGRVADTEAK